ncbi:FadR/GntR family transcriptional regulator [Pseudogracilibacillus sp. SO30301A]|uniref:FadR/GntR family transcriptional regulator n=1 Tax=Pseudogracilibacillus sp. SO30301A TaxID=3098291 RepID=UPI00300E0945
MLYEPISSKKNYEKVIEQIISMLKQKKLKAGDRLDSIEQLAKNFGVSRSVIREALSGLKGMGIVHIQHGEGTFIADFNADSISLPITTALLMKKEDIKELMEVRKILEVGAVRLAAQHRTHEDLVQIDQAIVDMKTNQLDEKSDYHFHFLITKSSRNKMLMNLLQSISKMMIETIRDAQEIILESENNKNLLINEHELIFKAIKNKQPEQAATYMIQHLESVEKSLSPYIN